MKFLEIIPADQVYVSNNLTVDKYFEHIVYIARKWTELGNE